MTWWVYIVQCSDGTYYTGISNDVQARIDTHNEGKGAKYTRARLPVALVDSVSCPGRVEALRLEAHVKKQPRNRKLSALHDCIPPKV